MSSYNAGEATGQAQAKKQGFVESAKGTAVGAKDHVADAAKSATNTGKDTTGTAKDHVGNAANSTSDTAKGTTNTAKDHVGNAANSTSDTAKGTTNTAREHVSSAAKSGSDAVKPKEPNLIQKTGENATNLAKGGVENVKSAVGMNK